MKIINTKQLNKMEDEVFVDNMIIYIEKKLKLLLLIQLSMNSRFWRSEGQCFRYMFFIL